MTGEASIDPSPHHPHHRRPDGLGLALAERLAADGTDLILHGRNQAKLDRIADQLAAREVSRPRTVTADLADLDQVRRMAAEIHASLDRLCVLVNNAGIGGGQPDGRTRRTSADGHELRFAVNYLAGFLLTLELLPLLRASAPVRIVNVASIGQHPLDFENLMLERDYDGLRAYGQSKLAQITSGFELAARLLADEVTVNSLHPATYMPTKIVLAEIGCSIDTLEEGVTATRQLVTDTRRPMIGRKRPRHPRTRSGPGHSGSPTPRNRACPASGRCPAGYRRASRRSRVPAPNVR